MNKIFNLPNCLTGARFLLAALLACLMSMDQSLRLSVISCLIFSLAAATDWVDGFIARRYKSETVLGKLMDPLADKVLVATALVMLIPLGVVPAWLALMILCREFIITGLRGVAASSGIVVAASGLGKIKSIIQYISLGMLIFPEGVLPIPELHATGLLILYVALILTVWSGFDYFFKLKKVFL
ncbi:MAG: CDP-diacylglycerol--glycerol-3-phosphate 3-phosphatidyltransferase [Desulfobulbaceae bacterium]|nr:CDP-diacylglycerol--glycerol-3-phosphate 3-phosphatidyltransferase [Desulfobulbaceae bacterium]